MKCLACGAEIDADASSCSACATRAVPIVPGALLAGRYEIQTLLGSGALGRVLIPPPRERVESRIVSRDAFVAADTNRYPVPYGWAGETVTVRILHEELVIHHPGGQAMRHDRLEGAHQVSRWEGPPRPMPWRQKGGRVPAADLEETGGQVEVRPLSEYEALVEALS